MKRPTVLLREASTPVNHLAQRVEAELDFARMLVKLQTSEAKNVSRAFAVAEKMAAEVFTSSHLATIRAGVDQIEKQLASVGKLAKQYTVYAVGHAHIDMNWMWGWPETVAVCNDSFATVLKLMDEFPTFHFSQSQASVYRIIEEYNPALLEKIKARVKEGRWEVTASHWVEGDRNMVSGESLTRHLLYTRKYLQQIFGLTPEDVQIDWSPDTFGHPLSVPMYLARGGVRYVYMHRPGALGPKRPLAFWWKSPDGSRVLVRNDMDNGYNGSFNPGIIHSLNRFCSETGLKFSNFVFGVGDHGGGPTRLDISRAIEMNDWPIFPEIRFSTAHEFYRRLEKEGGKLPTLDCELNTELAGCYTTQSLIKRSNRVAEHRLLDAEAACVVTSSATGRAYPAQQLEQAWRDTLFCHFHDILPGSNVHDSRTWMHGLFQKTIATTSMAETQALRELASKINTTVPGLKVVAPESSSQRAVLGAGAGHGSERNMLDAADNSGGGPRAVVVFNPTAFPREEVVEATLWQDVLAWPITDEMRARPISVRTPDGKMIPAQKLDFGNYWGHGFVKVVFPVSVPALGYATYTIVEEESEPAKMGAQQIERPHHCGYLIKERRCEGLKNEHLQLLINTETGGILSLGDRGNFLYHEFANTPDVQKSGLEYVLEKPHGMTAWLIDNITQRQRPQVLSIDRRHDGPYLASVDVRLKIKDSEFTLTYELRAGDPRLYIHLRGTWFERGGPQIGVPSLIFRFDVPVDQALDAYEIPFGSISGRGCNGNEVPALNWAMVSGNLPGSKHKECGVLLLNDSKHGHALEDTTLSLTLIRSAYDPDPLPDVGQHEIHLALMPFVGRMSPAAAIAQGKAFNRPLRLITTAIHNGALPPTASAIEVAPADVLLSDIKQSEDGKGVVLHLVNASDRKAQAKVRLGSLLGKFTDAVEVDLMERPLETSSAKLAAGQLTVSASANAVTSVKLSR